MSKTNSSPDLSSSAIEKPSDQWIGPRHRNPPRDDTGSARRDRKGQTEKILRSVGLGAAVVAVPGSLAYIYPAVASDAAVLAIAQIAADATLDYHRGRPYTLESAVESSVLATAMTIPLHHLFGIINTYFPTNSALDYVIKGSVWGGIAFPVYIAGYQFCDYLIKNRTLEGFGGYFRRYFVPVLKQSWLTIFPLSLANIFLIPAAAQIPITAALCYGLALFSTPKPKVEVEPRNEGRERIETQESSNWMAKIKSVYSAFSTRLRCWGRSGLLWAKRLLKPITS
ncbi:MAG: hypothetical protein ACRESZ_02775 [Methylococcales bacterium]